MWRELVFVLCAVCALVDGGYISWVQPQENKADAGHGLQVVKMLRGVDDQSEFVLDLPALKELLGREDVAGYPVVVVSVAGAFRGGKSFLLDFFLRYLNAPRSEQLSGEWLGNPNEPLRGFHWRGGSERDTNGIHLWSKPFHVRMEPTGEEVVVLLMDTQGTFDSESSNRDSTTIFALSTLLSSVQIYNLFRNIQENDLQHLHLFTDYGQKVSSSGKAFQQLKFLVRDWQNSEEYPYGHIGGNAYLANKLKVEQNQLKELRQVREHIHSCFENITCFLMPHPGLRVAKRHFSGSIADIEADFVTSLLELVPSLLDPKNLAPKVIGGHRVKGRDLILYFQNYVKNFNSKDLPPIISIEKGAEAAALMVANNAAREEYQKHMMEMDKETRSYTSASVQATHVAARDAAIRVFDGRIVLGAKEESDKVRKQLLEDLDRFLGSFNYNNGIKLREGRMAAFGEYKGTLCAQCGVQHKQQVCLNPTDLEHFHAVALAAALAKFDSMRRVKEQETDDERLKLQQELVKEYGDLRTLNKDNNDVAVKKALAMYLSSMSAPPAVTSTEQLQTRHDSARESATASFADSRNKPTMRTDDPYKKELLEVINKYYEDIKKNNAQTNELALLKAHQAYNDYVTSEWRPYDGCFNPQEIENLHEEAKQAAERMFREKSVDLDRDTYKNRLNEEMNVEHDRLKQRNHYTNVQAASSAFEEYVRAMDRKRGNTDVFSELFSNYDVGDAQRSAKSSAIQSFLQKRLRSKTCSNDVYLNELENKINGMFTETYNSFWTKLWNVVKKALVNFGTAIVSSLGAAGLAGVA